jgi:hypothetical protein
MTTDSSNNARLQTLVRASGLTQAVALTIFNRGLGAAACTDSTWRRYQASPDEARFLPLPDELLAHANQQFRPATTVDGPRHVLDRPAVRLA